DRAVESYPVKLTHRSGHAHVLNSLGLKRAGISVTTPDPPGGLIDRDFKTGEPTGLLYEMGHILSDRIPPISEREIKAGIRKANQYLLSLGMTSLQDASSMNDRSRWDFFKTCKEEGILEPRIRMMLGRSGFEDYCLNGFSKDIDQNHLAVGGVKIILDETTGRLLPSGEDLNGRVLGAHKRNFQVAIHAVEENAVEAACQSIGSALETIPRADHRHRIEHCSVCPPSMAKRIASLGIVVVSQPSFLFFHGERYLKTVPDRQAHFLYPFNTLLKKGVVLAGSSDCPIIAPNPFLGIYSAVTRKAQTGDAVVPEERISILQALRLYTIDAARASFEETMKGSISPGKLADLILLKGDPTRLPPDEIKDMEVEMTIIGGKVVWRRGG
ncbi:MAG: amidohydrolase family protein, partial [Pseudomonadota bacterium]